MPPSPRRPSLRPRREPTGSPSSRPPAPARRRGRPGAAPVASPPATPTAPGPYRFSLVATDSAAQAGAADEVVVTVLRSAVPQLTKYTYNGDGDRVKQEKDTVVTEYVQDS